MINYYVQLQAKFHQQLMRKISDDFEVCSTYLGKLSHSEFIEAYCALQALFKKYYEVAEAEPEKLGLPCYRTTTYRALGQEARDSELSLLWFPVFMYAIGCAGEVVGDHFEVTISRFKEVLKGRKHKHLPKQIEFLITQGFQLTGWEGSKFEKGVEVFQMRYPHNPNLFHVLKATTNKVLAIETNPKETQKFDFYRIPQFAHMLETLFQNPHGELIPHDEAYLLRVLATEDAAFLRSWLIFAKMEGMTLLIDPTLNKNRFIDEKGKDTLNFVELGSYRRGESGMGKLMLRLKLNHPDKYMAYIETLPDEMKSAFRNVGCGHCKPQCSRRITYRFDGEPKECCSCFGFEFWSMKVAYLEHYMALFQLEKEARKV